MQNSFSLCTAIYQRVLREELGLDMLDPAALFPSPEAAAGAMHAAGYHGAFVSTSVHPRLRSCTPEEFAAAAWRQWSGFPGLPLADCVPPQALKAAEAAFMAAAVEAARKAAVPGGVWEQHAMLLVVGRA